MQLSAAALFALNAITSLISALVFFKHEAFVRVLKAQGTSLPSGMTYDSLADTSIAIATASVVFIVILALVAAAGSFLGWRWMFWVALVLFAFGAIGALTNLSSFAKPDTSPVPVAWVAVSELLSLASAAMFVWMLVGVIKFGPWAMKKPGS